MLKKHDIICISSIDWDFIRQGHQEIMSAFAANGNRILFIENTGVRPPNLQDLPRMKKRISNWIHSVQGIRKVAENLYVYAPLVLPFPYSAIAVKINKFLMCSVIKRWMRAIEFYDPIVWSFLPTQIVLELLDELDPSMFIYYCIDDFASSSLGARNIRRTEEKVIKRANLVFATARNLYDRCSSLNRQTYLFPFGVSIAHYNAACEGTVKIPPDLERIKRPVIGYIGGLHKWMDFKLVREIALARKDISIVLIGPKQTELSDIEGIDNIFLLGNKEHEHLPAYVKFFDIGIIPYRVTPYTENVYPTKINEYLAMAKPVISTAIPEVIRFDKENGGDFIYFIEKPGEIGSIVDRALLGNNDAIIKKRIEVANANAWDRKIEAMCDLIEKEFEKIRLRINQSWAERLKYIYNRVRRKAARAAAAVFLFYFLVFHTSLVWLIASPLNVVGSPQRSDCIVVLGGGVGESGKAGQGYEERVGYSVELYKSGLADQLIFSSGYRNIFDETMIMKSLAVTLGVPEDTIILENDARNTYENIKFTAEIIKRRGWRSVLLITSPYHTLRASLVFKRQARGLKVTYVPLPNSQFYRHEIKNILHKKVTVEQMKGILHEYLGILYYKFKGWI